MYNHFFGFMDAPFKLVPNPDYLFLSKSHEEALAHLRYALLSGEGFIEIIGEIGTGKTLLCRTFLETLDADTESAYIFNPRLDVLDFLKLLNDELGIPHDFESIKMLIDALNTFLIEKKAAGKKVLLLIDEAQNLSRDVLEQVRLLSNLETTKEKLLQIVLAGQPELSQMLDAYELRQLRQRISLSCRLYPLTYAETTDYIAHRMHVAARKNAAVFSRPAIRRIYRFSGGIPRLINIVCDRSLLTAFGQNQRKVSGSIAKTAIQELTVREKLAARERKVSPDPNAGLKKGIAALLFCLVIFTGWTVFEFSRRPVSHEPHEKKSERALSSESNRRIGPKTLSAENSIAVTDFQQVLNHGADAFSKKAALKHIFQKWGKDMEISKDAGDPSDALRFFSGLAESAGLIVTPVNEDLTMILHLNLPVILEFNTRSGTADRYLTAVKALPDALLFLGLDSAPDITVSYAQVMEKWSGHGFVFWKNFYDYPGTFPMGAPKAAVIALKQHLKEIGYRYIDINGNYDNETLMVIKALQARHGIPIDGYVGPLTQIVLYNDQPSLPIPHLWEPMAFPATIARQQ